MPSLACDHCGEPIKVLTNKRQARLAHELLYGGHKTTRDALRASGYSESTAIDGAHRVSHNVTVVSEMTRLKQEENRKKGSLIDKVKSIQRSAVDVLSHNVTRIQDAAPAQAIQLAGGTLKVTSDYLRDAPDDDERVDLSEVQALALRLVAGGIRLGASLGTRACDTLARYASRLEGTKYELSPTPRLAPHSRRMLPAKGDTSGHPSVSKAKR